MDKEERMRANRSFNENYAIILDQKFSVGTIMDPRDLLQVRYEIVRAIAYEKEPVSDISHKFGISERTARRYIKDMKDGGLLALMPGHGGPTAPYQMTSDVTSCIDDYLKDHPHASGQKVFDAIAGKIDKTIGKRSVDRYLSKKGRGGR